MAVDQNIRSEQPQKPGSIENQVRVTDRRHGCLRARAWHRLRAGSRVSDRY